METLTTEEKAKRYDDLLVKLQEAKTDNDVCDERYCCVIDDIVPELKVSEDERIKKWCISHFRECFRVTSDNVAYQEYLNNKVIPWLEKQGKKGANGNNEEIPNSAWSEEDEKMLNSFLHKLEVCQLLSNKENVWAIRKFKALKDRCTWIPSEEQIKAVRLARSFVTDDFSDNPTLSEILTELEEQLKKLREE